ncbi:MAG: hypothetical protein M3N53_04140 [Actinomycetota bacterium]|nr:hypothetical protein [Actinomycetota bacterium]
MTLWPKIQEWVQVTIWRALRDAPTTPRKDISEEDIGRMEAQRPKREREAKEA